MKHGHYFFEIKEIGGEIKCTSWRTAAEFPQIVSYPSKTDVSQERQHQQFKGFRGELFQVTTRQVTVIYILRSNQWRI